MSQLVTKQIVLENVTENITSIGQTYGPAYSFSFLVLVTLFILISIGNLSVLTSIYKTAKGSRMKLFIANLATNDLLVAVGAILPRIIWILTVEFLGPCFVCKLVKYLASTVHYGSAFALVTLSLDRLDAIIRPLRLSRGRRNSYMLAGAGWVLAMICGSPGFILAEIRILSNSQRQCWINFNSTSPKIYITYVATSVFIIPAILIAVSHILIIVRIVQAAGKQALSGAGCSRGCIPRARVKTAQMTCVIVSVFVICWCPYMVWNLLITYEVIDHHKSHMRNTSIIIQNLAPLNSAANPVIYWIFKTKKCSCRQERRRNAGAYTNSQASPRRPLHHSPEYQTVIQQPEISSSGSLAGKASQSTTKTNTPNNNHHSKFQWKKKPVKVEFRSSEQPCTTNCLLTVNNNVSGHHSNIELSEVTTYNRHIR